MEPIFILADDLTGAADTASRCHAAGLPATIFLAPPRPPLPAGVVAFTSDSRHLPPTEAAERVQIVAAPLVGQPARWYKKIDSTLRGNIGSELDALFDLFDAPAALVCPSFPAQGRGLVSGHLVAPGGPPVGIHLPSLLREQSGYPVQSFSLEDVRSGELVERIQRRDAKVKGRKAGNGHQIFVVDALTDGDLGLIVDVAEAMPGFLLCGSAGLIGEMAKQRMKREEPPGFRKPGGSSERALVVVGSGSEMAHRQISGLLTAYPTTQHLLVEPGRTVTNSRPAALTLLHQSPPAPGTLLDGPEARERAELLADTALAIIEQSQPNLLLLVGGDTAVAVLSRLGVDRLTVQAELLPGMPLCIAEINGQELRVVMKPGSFGDENALVALLEHSNIQTFER